MMSDMVRRPSEQCSPKTSPRGNRSPVVVPRQDSTGTLKTTISLGKTPAIVHSGPFYLMKELPPKSDITGATNLIQCKTLEHSFNRFCGRKIKDQLSAFLPNLPGNIDVPAAQDDSSLRKMIEKPPITSIEITTLTKQQLDSAFRLHIGPVPERFRFMNHMVQRKRHKHKKSKTGKSAGIGNDSPVNDGLHPETTSDLTISNREHEKKHKKQKRHDEERRKKKKDKKKKKRHSPDSPPHDTIQMDSSPMMSSLHLSSGTTSAGPGTPSSNPNVLASSSASSGHQQTNSTSGNTLQHPTNCTNLSNGLGNANSGSNSGRLII